MKRFFIRFVNYEYWPMWAFYLPLSFYFLFKGILKRHLFFFTNVNQGMDEYGGLFFDSKSQVDNWIPQKYRPISLLIKKQDLLSFQLPTSIAFPIIIKPNSGERGRAVVKINSNLELNQSLKLCDEDMLVQEYIDYQNEYGVFVSWIPDLKIFKILSLTEKKFFRVVGDGNSTIKELILKQKRGVVFYKELIRITELDINMIPDYGHELIVHTQGNHCKGTEFINSNYKITEKMQSSFNQLLQEIKVFEFGRFDIKVFEFHRLETLENFKIIEFNGLAAEPTIVYDQKVGYIKALKTFIEHWSYLVKISNYHKNNGLNPLNSRRIVKKIQSRILTKSG